MVGLEPPNKRTLGIAKWLGVTVKPGDSDAHVRQSINNAPLPPALVEIAKRCELDVSGLNYGVGWPLIKRHRRKIEADLMQNAGWEVSKILSLNDEFWIITDIETQGEGGRAKLTLRILLPPRVLKVKKTANKPAAISGLVMRLGAPRTVTPLDLLEARIRNPEGLRFY